MGTGIVLDPEGEPVSPVRVRPVGGAAGCLAMILVSVVLSVLLTVVLNLAIR
jgi:hypothetical protein